MGSMRNDNQRSDAGEHLAGDGSSVDSGGHTRALTPAARRALAEAEERRRLENSGIPRAPEVGGRDGPEPTRFGDWENGGVASDF